MADYVSREVARDRLQRACKAATIVSVLVLLLGLFFAVIAAVLALNVALPFQVMYTAIDMVIDSIDDVVLGTAEAGTKAVLFFLMGLFGILACRKIDKTGEAFGLRQLKRIKFVAFLTVLAGFLPTLVADIAKTVFAFREGTPLFMDLSIDVEPLCILVGLVMFMLMRVLVAGSLYESQSDELLAEQPKAEIAEPDYSGVPDIASVTTATPLVQEAKTEVRSSPSDFEPVPAGSDGITGAEDFQPTDSSESQESEA